jgi:predicted nucleotide-binding protein (sugar kinase/HSP70/actin superfamily)
MNKFSIVEKGYSVNEVNKFVDDVIRQTEGMLEKMKRQRNENEMLRAEIEKYRKIENDLKTALFRAEQSGSDIKRHAYEEKNSIIEEARKNKQRIIVLAGRPYHVDPQVNHGIDKMIADFGICVITEESISHLNEKFPVNVLNQWTYHSRLYSAAKICSNSDDMNLVQLVSFGCGLDAVTTDECREIIESKGKIYTQIKIDEITNLGAVKIRIRSLLTALEQKGGC